MCTHQQHTPKVLLSLGKLMQFLFRAFLRKYGLSAALGSHTHHLQPVKWPMQPWDGIAVPGCCSPIVVSGRELFSGTRCPVLQTLTMLADFT